VNQFALATTQRRLTFILGNLSTWDLFDANAYSHDPRTQFLNWALVSHGAWDSAADARGYTWGGAMELRDGDWALRAGRFAQPKESNGPTLDGRLGKHYGDQVELEHDHEWAGQPGALRLLAFRNRARMARYDDALALGAATASVPDLNAVRGGEQTKRGWGLGLEQQLHPDIGFFARASASDGATEAYAFTEIDRSLSAGVLLRGSAWGRGQDTLGLAFARNGLSAAHRDYLAAGGLGYFLGDGQLRYRAERVFETFYNVQLLPQATLGLDWQHIAHPGYNADRGPARFVGLRLHMEL
jgi:carbohydrate-selective porin OprB